MMGSRRPGLAGTEAWFRRFRGFPFGCGAHGGMTGRPHRLLLSKLGHALHDRNQVGVQGVLLGGAAIGILDPN